VIAALHVGPRPDVFTSPWPRSAAAEIRRDTSSPAPSSQPSAIHRSHNHLLLTKAGTVCSRGKPFGQNPNVLSQPAQRDGPGVVPRAVSVFQMSACSGGG